MLYTFASYTSMLVLLFCFFKQKTAYEMRISDWSSDVCSSDLLIARRRGVFPGPVPGNRPGTPRDSYRNLYLPNGRHGHAHSGAFARRLCAGRESPGAD